MADARLVDYIRTQLKNGYSIRKIKTTLLQQGWAEYDIQEAMDFARSGQDMVPPPVPNQPKPIIKNMGFFDKLKMVIIDPERLFNSVREEPLSKSFVYFAIITLVPMVVAAAILSFVFSLFSAILPADVGSSFGLFGLLGPVIAIPFYLLALVFSFVIGAVIFVFARIFGSKGSYTDTYKAIAYGSTPANLLFFIPIVSPIWSLYLEIKGLSVLHRISMGRAAVIIIAPVIVVTAILIAAALFAVGLFNTATFTQPTISGFQNFYVPQGGWQLSQTKFTLILNNGVGDSINITDGTALYQTNINTRMSVSGYSVGNGRGYVLQPGSEATIVYDIDGPPPGTAYTVFADVEYDNMRTGSRGFTTSGTLTGTSI
ncbi:MAG: Yip1 family protein [Candidatus Aenigmatarchaeota archaeon]|nr:YIP1 family protein [Nanoarchaeota archaeon]